GVDYQLSLTTTNTLLQDLMKDMTGRTNNPEGFLNGDLEISRANTEDTRTLSGYGSVELRDGLIWAIPIFGMFSPVLDSIVPGLGSSRASSGSGDFIITNGIIRSRDLEIRSPAMRI